MVYEELDSTGAANEILNIREPVRALPSTPRHSLVDGPVQQIDGDGPLVPGIIERARAGASVEVEGTCRTDEGVLAGATNEALNIVECIRALPSMKDSPLRLPGSKWAPSSPIPCQQFLLVGQVGRATVRP